MKTKANSLLNDDEYVVKVPRVEENSHKKVYHPLQTLKRSLSDGYKLGVVIDSEASLTEPNYAVALISDTEVIVLLEGNTNTETNIISLDLSQISDKYDDDARKHVKKMINDVDNITLVLNINTLTFTAWQWGGSKEECSVDVRVDESLTYYTIKF